MSCASARPAAPRRPTVAVLACVLAVAGTAATARAQGYGPPLGSLHLSFDPVRWVESRQVAPLSDFDLYLLADFDFGDLGHPEWNATLGMSAYELGLVLPSSVSIVRAEFFPSGAAPRLVAQKNGVLSMVVVFDANCLLAQDAPAVLFHITARLLADARDVRMGITAAEPSSFSSQTGGPGPAPGWLQCPQISGQLYPFADYSGEGSLVVNPGSTGVASGARSWGALKATYDQ